MSLAEAMGPVWMRLRRACGGGMRAPREISPECMRSERSADRRVRRLDQLERIYVAGDAGLWGDMSVIVAMAEALQSDRLAERRSER